MLFPMTFIFRHLAVLNAALWYLTVCYQLLMQSLVLYLTAQFDLASLMTNTYN